MAFTEEQNEIREMISAFAVNELRPRAESIDENCAFPTESVRELSELGILGATIPESFGGFDGDGLTSVLIAYELARGCSSTAYVVGTHALCVSAALSKFGSDEQKQSYLPQLASGSVLGTSALYEPKADRACANFTLAASPEGDEWVLEGVKSQVVAAEHAKLYLVAAVLSGSSTPGLFLVEREANADRLTIDSATPTLGLRGAGIGTVAFERCRASRIGESSEAEDLLAHVAALGHLTAAAVTLGLCRSAWEYAIGYARKRQAFGGPISRFQVLQGYFADAATASESSELLLFHAASLLDSGSSFTKEASMAKIAANNAAYAATKNAVQILGGNGFSREYPVERYYRDAQTFDVLEAPAAQHRLMIAASLIGDES